MGLLAGRRRHAVLGMLRLTRAECSLDPIRRFILFSSSAPAPFKKQNMHVHHRHACSAIEVYGLSVSFQACWSVLGISGPDIMIPSVLRSINPDF